MASISSSCGPSGRLLALSAEVNRAETVETAVSRAVELATVAFDRPAVRVYEHDPTAGTAVTVGPSSPSSTPVDGAFDRIPDPVIDRLGERGPDPSAEGTPEATVDADPTGSVQAEAFVPVGTDRVLCLGVTDPEGFDEAGVTAVEGVAANLETALARIDRRNPAPTARGSAGDPSVRPGDGDPTFVTDADGRLVTVDRATLELTGHDRAELLTTGLSGLLDDAAGGETPTEHLARARAEGSASLATTLRREDGTTVPVELVSEGIEVDGSPRVRTTALVQTTARDRSTARDDSTPAGSKPELRRPGGSVDGEADALRCLTELVTDADDFEDTVGELLSLGCEYFELDAGILSRVDGDDYELEAVVDATGTHEAGAVYDLGETMCRATLAGDAEPLAFADVSETDYRRHPAAESVRAYVAAPVVVDGETYGTVNFSMGTPRAAAFDRAEREFVTLLARWIGTEIERRRRVGELERYETVLEALGDPVYALDAEGRFTYVNEAAKREFGYGTEVVGEEPSVGMDDSDVERIREGIAELLAGDERTTTAEFELETADGARKVVENRLALIGDGEFRGTAGVLRDVTTRNERRRQLESFQRAIEEAADGVAVLEDGEYTYVDRTHVELYGLEDEAQLLGDTWRRLYDEEEIERLEAEAFPALESRGHWRGMVTGSRPDGSTFPAELSLTIVGDGRLVCTVRDETDRRERERRTEARKDLLKRVYELSTDPGLSLERKVSGLLEAGRDHLDLPYGFLTRIEDAEGGESGTQTIVEALGSHERLQPGESTPVERSYCRKTVEGDGRMALTHAADAGWADDPAHDAFELETYIGSEVVAGDDLYGTVCFASTEPRGREFDEFERSFIGLVGRWVGYEIDRRNSRERLRRQRERLELTLSGTNTGLLEWDLETDAVTLNETLVDVVGRDVESIGEFETAIHPGDRDRVRERMGTMLDTGEPWVGEFRVLDGDGSVVWIKTRAVVDDGDGDPTRVLATGTDVTGRKREERERRRNERRFESLFEDPQTLVGLLDTDGTVLEVNETAMQYVDATRDAVRGEWFPETPWWSHSEALQADLEGWLRRAADGEYFDYEATHAGPDGDSRHVTGTVRPVVDESGSVESLVVTGRDVTERKRRERELEDRQRKLDLVLSNTDTSIVELDLESGTLRWDEMLGDDDIGSPETVEGLLETVHPEDRPRVQSAIGRMTDEGEPADLEFRLIDEDGDVVWVAGEAVAVTDEEGASTGRVVAIATDVTELKGREEALAESQRRYRTLLEAAPDPVVVADAETGEIIEVNAAAEAATGRPREDLVGRNQVDIHPEEDRESYRAAFEEAAEGQSLTSELPDGTQPKLCRADGGTVPVEINADVVDLPEGPVVYGVFRDVSERLEREASLRASERRYRSLARNIPNGGVLTFDADLRYDLAAGELLSELGLDPSEISGTKAGSVLHDAEIREELLGRLRAALDGERTDRRVELGDRTLRIHVSPVDPGDGQSVETRGLVLAQDVTEEARRERELIEERERFRLLVESVEEYAFLVVDEDGTIRTWNEGASDLFGYDAETAVGTSMAALHPESDRESGRPDRLLQQARIAGESADEGWRVRADGSEFYADVRYAPLEADDGDFRGYATVVRDMTDRRRQRRRTERFVEESNDVVTVVDPDGTITYASGSADRVLGHDPEDLVGGNLFDHVHPEGRESAMETFYAGVDDPDADLRAECRIRSGDGEWRNVEGQCRNMLDDDAIDGMLLYLRDVTENKKRSRRFESIFNQTFQFTGLLEPDGTVVEANDAAFEFGGIGHEEIVGDSFLDAPWWTHSETVRDGVREALDRARRGEFVRYETTARGADGLATIDFSVKPVTDEDGDVSLIVVEGRDVTAKQQRRRHLEVMQRLMRHNMRNDLTAMRGWTQVMAEEDDAGKRAEQLETIDGILDKWTSMTEKMKRMREVLDSGSDGRATTEAESLLETAVAPVREDYPEATVTVDAGDAGSTRVPATLLVAVRELVANGARASESPRVDVEFGRPENRWVEVSVRDDGPGMPEMEADVLETGEETPLSHGEGLGLWMVRTVVTQAGGDVSVESTTDGTTVCLRLPVDRGVRTTG